ncbi:MAG: hypothetical protein LBI70_03145 [Rickettsiales bacterium]|jgi:hypothetical protein|nr:hypothetical protein [Rickettsiales bacterium]
MLNSNVKNAKKLSALTFVLLLSVLLNPELARSEKEKTTDYADHKESNYKFIKYILPDSGLYEGEYKDSRRNGKGKLILSNGITYEGYFKNGLPDGEGIFTFADGTNLEGHWTDGEFQEDKNKSAGSGTNGDKNKYVGAETNDKKTNGNKGISEYTDDSKGIPGNTNNNREITGISLANSRIIFSNTLTNVLASDKSKKWISTGYVNSSQDKEFSSSGTEIWNSTLCFSGILKDEYSIASFLSVSTVNYSPKNSEKLEDFVIGAGIRLGIFALDNMTLGITTYKAITLSRISGEITGVRVYDSGLALDFSYGFNINELYSLKPVVQLSCLNSILIGKLYDDFFKIQPSHHLNSTSEELDDDFSEIQSSHLNSTQKKLDSDFSGLGSITLKCTLENSLALLKTTELTLTIGPSFLISSWGNAIELQRDKNTLTIALALKNKLVGSSLIFLTLDFNRGLGHRGNQDFALNVGLKF